MEELLLNGNQVLYLACKLSVYASESALLCFALHWALLALFVIFPLWQSQ